MPKSPQQPTPYTAAGTNPLAPPPDSIASLRTALRGHYEFERELGQGAFATVYLAQDLKHERKVAVKVLHADPTSETGELRFIREIRLLARLQHPNILPLHDSGHVEALLYYVMPYVAGETLRGRINREARLDLASACNVAREVADALAYAHGQGVIHRDIKPENILLSAGHPILADFGIARAIDLAGVRQLTQTGMGSPGTPAYMSPEQLMGDRELDGRSDTYSLGCVLYEMVVGRPPFSGKEGFVRRFTEDPPRASLDRRDAPPALDTVIATALARNQSERYQSAQEFANALSELTSANSNPRYNAREAKPLAPYAANPDVNATQFRAPLNVRTAIAEEQRAQSRASLWGRLRDTVRTHSTLVAASTVAVVLIGTFVASNASSLLRNAVFRPHVDTARIALVPSSGTASIAARDQLTNALYAALSEWRDLPLVSDQDMADAFRSGGPPSSTRSAAALAAHAGAGRFIWAQIDAIDSSQARVQLYDAASGTLLRSIRFARDGDTGESARVVRQLLMPENRPADADGGDGRTNSFSAWRDYAGGHIALRSGLIDTAEKKFLDAATADPDFGPAWVWLAQARAWKSGSKPQDWRDDVAHGLHARSGLGDRDRFLARALSSLADKEYPDACATYARLIAADSLDFAAFYGLGQCQALDSLVVPSSSSPSRWAFRSRYSDAASAFERAVRANPSAHAILSFDQLQRLLPIDATKTRRGTNAAGQEFAAFPALVRDTVLFVPYPLAEFGRLSARQTAVQQSGALSRNLQRLLEFALDWTRDAPQSAPAFQALADVREARGEITRSDSTGMSAVQAVARARLLAATPHDRIVAATSAAWLFFKQGEFVHATALADSVLAAPRRSIAEEAQTIIGLAALTGKLARTAELARVTTPYASSAFNLPVPVMDAAAPFFAFAALGVCSDTTARLESRLDDQIAHSVAEDQQTQISAAVKTRPLSMLAPCTGGKASLRIPSYGASRLIAMQQALARGDLVQVRSMLKAIGADARTQRPGDISLDIAYQYAWIRAAVGDTAGAVAQLDRTLGALPSIGAAALREPGSSAAAVRAMALRADLARARGETKERLKWGRSVAELWAHADAPLDETVRRMRSFATPTN
ncbi:MAG TPA: serine/threonine-protein kinase [Gemmatimonadaceae bacterium]